MSNVHSQQTVADGIHGGVAYEPADATALAAITPSSTNKYKSACRQDDGSLWTVLPIPAGGGFQWVKIANGPTAFSGDFGALFNSYSPLNTRAYFRGDLGVSGTTGTGKSALANQLGDGSAMGPASGATNGIGAVSTGLNGKPGIITNGATQGCLYTFPSQPAPATTNGNIYAIWRIVSPAASVGYIHSAANNNSLYMFASQTPPAADMQLTTGSGGCSTSGVVTNQWYRARVSRIGGNDVLRVGAHEPTPITTTNSAAGTSWGFGCAYDGSAKCLMELLLLLHVEGPMSTFLTACADADAKARTFWSTAIEI